MMWSTILKKLAMAAIPSIIEVGKKFFENIPERFMLTLKMKLLARFQSWKILFVSIRNLFSRSLKRTTTNLNNLLQMLS